jgi:hypothetical protein
MISKTKPLIEQMYSTAEMAIQIYLFWAKARRVGRRERRGRARTARRRSKAREERTTGRGDL